MTADATGRPEEGSDDGVEAAALPSLARLYLGAVYVGAAGAGALAVLSSGLEADGGDLGAFAVLAALAAAAQLFRVDAPSRHSYHTTPAFLLAAILLLPPPLLVVLGLLILLPEWARYRYPWYIQSFNIATYMLNMLIASYAFILVAGGSGLAVEWSVAVAAALAALSFSLANHLMVGLVLSFARGISIRESRVFARDSLETDLTLLFLGVGMAVLWTVHPLLLAVGVAPLFLFYRALHVPQLQEEAYTDAKTGLLTARRFSELLREELARSQRSRRPAAVVMADLDLLRNVNNTHGHLAGDAALQAAAQAIKRCLRPGDLAGRLGGEEFALLLPSPAPTRRSPSPSASGRTSPRWTSPCPIAMNRCG